MKPIVQVLFNTVLPIVAIVLAIMGFRALVAARPEPPRHTPENRGVLVQTETAVEVREQMRVVGFGEVVAARQVTLQPQVSGRIEWIADTLVVGGLIDEGAELVRVERDDFRIAIAEAEAAVAQAEVQLRLERGRQDVAAREWEIFRSSASEDADAALALREPQVRSAEVAIESAEARVDRARLDLSRTRVEAPFPSLVIQEAVEIGQVISPQSPIATLVDTGEFWVEVAVPLDQLSRLAIPGVNATEGSLAVVEQRMGDDVVRRPGRVLRLLGELDRAGRLARVLVAVQDPMGFDVPDPSQMPLLLGAYVRVEIEGRDMQDVVALPRQALREGDLVFVATDERTLDIRTVDIAWRRPDTVLLSAGLEAGEQYIVSGIPAPAQGMLLRLASDADGSGGAAQEARQ